MKTVLPGEELIRQLKKDVFRYEVGWEGKENFAIGSVVLSISTNFFPLASLCLSFFLLLWFSPFILLSSFSFFPYNFSVANPCPSPAETSAGGIQQRDHFTTWERWRSAPNGGNPECEHSAHYPQPGAEGWFPHHPFQSPQLLMRPSCQHSWKVLELFFRSL